MSKRYVESTLFTDPWFRKLSPEAKLFWHFLTLHCDNSGVWVRDDDYASYLTGLEKSPKTLLKELGDRILQLDPEKVLLPKFILFQQGKTLSNAKPPHRQIIKLLLKHNLEMDANGITTPILNLTLTKAKPKVKQGVTNPLVTSNSNSNGNSNSKSKERGTGKTIPDPTTVLPAELDLPEFHSAWIEWTAYRKERKLPNYKPIGLASLLSQLSIWANTHGIRAVTSSLRTSIANSWRGVFEPKSNPNQLINPNHVDYSKAFDVPTDFLDQ